MKVIYITHYTDLYGANKSLLDLIEGLSSDVDFHLVVPNEGRLTTVASKRNIPYTIIPFYNEVYFKGQDQQLDFKRVMTERAKGIVKFLHNWRLVIKHSSLFKDYDIIHMNSSATLIGAYFSLWTRKKLVWHIREFGWQDYKFRYNFGYKYFMFWLNKADTVISISKAIYQKRVIDSKAGIKKIVYNGVISIKTLKQHIEAISNKKEEPQKEFVFALVGHLSEEKGQLEALRAFHQLYTKCKNIRLILAGSGPDDYTAMLKAYVQELGLGANVDFTGYIADIRGVYTSIDCLLMCSKHEALGRVTIEAMSFGKPVIGYDAAGTKEIIQDGENGLLYLGEADVLAEKMAILALDKALQEKLSRNAFNSVKKFTIEEYAETVKDIYASLTVSESIN
ncbi:glycosyltransferase family 4 protein [Chitinophaga silvisoli]|uniref:Glycosyltransferase family 1 protein n=1 Tax=Chitinophaga silvisoli TaxID=2291814 RepID=A0A3E1P6P2_9BACT|nr:glycosyltransferase family 4 protein [Chitinophaga silvisoli]RFM35856.1 glycosyltransferase family 1 protein [Chitinophaga silvisoli]